MPRSDDTQGEGTRAEGPSFARRTLLPLRIVVSWMRRLFTRLEGALGGRAVSNTGDEPTDRGELEQQLREREQQLQTVMDTAPDSIIIADESGEIIYANCSAERMFGYSTDEMVGSELTVLMPERFEEAHTEGVERFLETGEPRVVGSTAELAGCRKDGTEFPLELSLETWKRADGSVAFTGILRDITEQKKHVEQLEESRAELREAMEEAEEANRAKTRFLANMSHDIRTPMNGVIGFTELLLETELDEVQQNYVRLIDQSANSLLHLLNDILDFSKMEAGEFELEPTYFRLCNVIGDALQAQAKRAYEKGLGLAYRTPLELAGYQLIGDRLRLRQVVDNLVGNALKFTDEGDIHIEVDVEEMDGEEVELLFRVRDTGVGIDQRQQDEIFESFRQSSPDTGSRDGVGLGLSIASSLVELMGGSLTLQSEVGEGSTFSFTARFGLVEKPVIDEIEHDYLAGTRVLIADDIAMNRRILEDIAQHWGMEAVVVDGGEEAVEYLRDAATPGSEVDVVLLDHLMPEMTGWDVVEALHANSDLSAPPVVLLSSTGERALDPEKFEKFNIVRALPKPVKQIELLDAIAMAMDRPGLKESSSEWQVLAHTTLDILVAEDSRVNQTLLRRLLDKRGHRVELAENGEEALEHYENGRFDLVLMDIEMPRMDGLEATRRIRALQDENGTEHTPIVALTAHAMRGDRERALEEGMDEYISKPVRADDLYRTIEKFVDS